MDQPEELELESLEGESAASWPNADCLSPEMRQQWWLETTAVLALWYAPRLFWAVMSLSWPAAEASPFAKTMLWRCVQAASITAVILYLIWRNGERFSTFGLARPRWFVDPLLGLGIGIVKIVTGVWCSRLLRVVLSHDAYSAVFATVHYPHPKFEPDAVAYLLLVIGEAAGGFAEELVMRGYLIPRFERLLNSTAASILLTTALFAAYHIYQGPRGVVYCAVAGLVYGGAFCVLRRLWPLALAHATYNILVTLSAR